MRPVDRRVPLRDALLVLGIWALLAPAQCFQGRPLWRYSSSEVVIPKKEVQHGRVLQMPGRLSYSLHFGGQKHVIHLWRKNLLWPRHLQLTTQDDQGALQMDYPYIPGDCYYLGHLEEVPLSMATIEMCSGGLEGIMKLDDLAYEITPLKDSRSFEHTVSQIVADINATGPTYNLDHQEDLDPLFPEANFSATPRISNKMYSSHIGAIKAHVQFSKSMYNLFNNMSACTKYMIDMFSVVDNIFANIDFRVYIFMLTIYNVNDPVTLNDFRVLSSPVVDYYIRNFYRPFLPASSTILLHDALHESDFEPYMYAMCSERSVLFTSQFGRHYLLLAIINANQQGRLFGLTYDTDDCVCQRRTSCIMNRFPGITDVFSNCSYMHVQHVVANDRMNTCYYRSTWDMQNMTLTWIRCGNYRVEETELCDCGSLKECYSNDCCETNCHLTMGSACDQGTCCTNCTYTPLGTLCRSIQNICDLPEYCNGNNVQCPDDFYLQNGTPCSEEGYCFEGNCTDRTIHCKEIFGADAKNADDACYYINTERHRFGHCLRLEHKAKHTGCSVGDMHCGRLQCTNVTQLPQLPEHIAFHQSLVDGSLCFGLDEHRATASNDAGRVRQGTPCDSEKMCMNNSCGEKLTALKYDCPPEKCNYRGVCNNNRNCHCHVGWDPPECLKLGSGGSLDSGPPPRKVRAVSPSLDMLLYFRVIIGRIYALLAILLLGVATNVRNIKTIKIEEEIDFEIGGAQKEVIPQGLEMDLANLPAPRNET